MYAMNAKLSETYARLHPEAAFRVLDAGTNKGIAALASGETDIAAATRELKPEEAKAIRKRYNRDAVASLVAIEGVSIYLHPRNPVTELTLEQLSGIFSGRITNWKEVGGADAPISVHSFSNDAGRYYFVLEYVNGRQPFAKTTAFTKPNPSLAPNQRLVDEEKQILKAVSENPNAIAYGDLKKVRMVKIAQIRTTDGAFWPTPENLQAGRYPLARRLMYFARPDAAPPVLDFVRWAPRQTEIIREMNFAPAKQ